MFSPGPITGGWWWWEGGEGGEKTDCEDRKLDPRGPIETTHPHSHTPNKLQCIGLSIDCPVFALTRKLRHFSFRNILQGKKKFRLEPFRKYCISKLVETFLHIRFLRFSHRIVYCILLNVRFQTFFLLLFFRVTFL